ncbi:glutaredoxin-like protein NrdH [Humibacter sp. BT305]|jgi:glutaredoxin-like protein NrdH|uniref:Glutaredoxin-like protein NrdH n=1 Tax=Cnuibacter physcomitrellae TaxID=1619308 RepID=A0A1X9LQJ3_9MICO|nr:glutaredoxin-like protein NrdH [Cnuibacter physcomitrellae]ARJ06201.1 NrdH-redoxin [Cnuibacter physcomitrellae]AXH35137.1 glutaredoxin-like protein NrdH [Humibacter sp. BT305]MCS5496013.1 glutaredoxin-like protein NrdH [Cnuibacter physcomitrellae]GGI37442.1 NrdH-redoxin [Cnuibacter physcomitrellae]
MAITVYTKPSCVQCNATYRALENKGLEYEIFDLSVDEKALETVKELGYLQAPVVITDNDSWSGFRPDKIEELARLAAS